VFSQGVGAIKATAAHLALQIPKADDSKYHQAFYRFVSTDYDF